MITTRIEPPVLNVSFNNTVTVDTKANMLMAAEIWGLRLPKSWRKDEIAHALNYCLFHDTHPSFPPSIDAKSSGDALSDKRWMLMISICQHLIITTIGFEQQPKTCFPCATRHSHAIWTE